MSETWHDRICREAEERFEENAYPCPRCGTPTTGSFSFHGSPVAICDDCAEHDDPPPGECEKGVAK